MCICPSVSIDMLFVNNHGHFWLKSTLPHNTNNNLGTIPEWSMHICAYIHMSIWSKTQLINHMQCAYVYLCKVRFINHRCHFRLKNTLPHNRNKHFRTITKCTIYICTHIYMVYKHYVSIKMWKGIMYFIHLLPTTLCLYLLNS